MKAINITLLFDGQTEEAFAFYKTVFGGEYLNLQRMTDIPDNPMPPEEANKILHMSLPVGNSILMGMDAPVGRMVLNKGNNFMVTLDTSSRDENTRLFNAMAEGGIITMPLADQFWGSFFGMVTDKFGIQWMFSYVK